MSSASWARHVKLPSEQALPVPRLELVYKQEKNDWFAYTIFYQLVYRHLLGHCIGVPLGHTVLHQGRDAMPLDEDGRIILPFRDGAHIASDARHLGLPAFAVLGTVVQPIEPRKEGPQPLPARKRKMSP